METHKAKIKYNDEKYFLSLEINKDTYEIPLSEDLPVEIQKVFNALIIELKNGIFEFELEEPNDKDIIYHIATEYLLQLNTEIQDIYSEMEQHNLLEPLA